MDEGRHTTRYHHPGEHGHDYALPLPQCVALAQRDAGDADGYPGHTDRHARNADQHARHANEHTCDADAHHTAYEHAGPADKHLHEYAAAHEHARHAHASETLRRRQPGPEHHKR